MVWLVMVVPGRALWESLRVRADSLSFNRFRVISEAVASGFRTIGRAAFSLTGRVGLVLSHY
jgi:hypothetical protein